MTGRTIIIALLVALMACQPAEEQQGYSQPTTRENPCKELEGFAALACAKPTWRQSDNELNRMLARVQARATHSEKADFRNAQNRWEKTRDRCFEEPRPRREPCLTALYSERMSELTDLLDD